MLSTAIERDVLAPKRLHDEVADDTAIVGMHAWAIGVEDARHLDLQRVLAVVIKKQGLGATLAFVVATTDANGIDVAPIALDLRMNCRVAIYLTSRCLKNLGAKAFGKAQHVYGSVHAGLGGLYRVVLIVNGAGRAGQIVDLVDLHVKRKRDIVAGQFKPVMVQQMRDIVFGTSEKIVNAQDIVPLCKKAIAQMAA